MGESPHPKRPGYRLGGLSGFMPLSEEPQFTSTRGQHLPGLISSRSNNSLLTLRDPGLAHRASFKVNDEEAPDGSPTTRRGSISEVDARRMSVGVEILAQTRSMRLIGNSNPRYQWEQYYKSKEELKKYSKPLRKYYERNNYLIAQYLYIDRLLDSSLPHQLLQEYVQPSQINLDIPKTIDEEPATPTEPTTPTAEIGSESTENRAENGFQTSVRVKRTPKNLYKLPDEDTPLLARTQTVADLEAEMNDDNEDVDSQSSVVTVALYINLIANFLLLIGKIAVIVLTSSLSVLASLVDAALDFLSTAIVWTTTKLIARQDQYHYPIGRRRLEPVGVLVFSVVMITSFFQVALECFNRLMGDDHSIVELGIPAIVIMVSTVGIKGFCFVWCRLIKNSSVQALAQDAITDVVFNTFSIIFPLIGFYAKIWWLDALGGLLLSFYVIINWASTSSQHIRNLTGAAATADERNILLYLAMRFAKPIKCIQALQAYHAGDKLNVEVDIVLDEDMSLRDSHDWGESLQYVLESVPTVDRAFVHTDYLDLNLPNHMNQQGD